MKNRTQLPTIIFLEQHTDTAANRIITQLMPALKSLGYKTYFDEYPSGEFIQDSDTKDPAEYVQKMMQNAMLQAKQILEQMAGIPNDPCFDQASFIAGQFKPSKNFAEFIASHGDLKDEYGYTISDSFNLMSALCEFMQALVQNGIQYRGIDDPSVSGLDRVRSEYMPQRDRWMAGEYLKVTDPVFGRNGIDHLFGLLKNLQKQRTEEEINNQFIFVFIYSVPREELDISPDLYNDLFKNESFPIPLSIFDARVTSDEVIRESILCAIAKRVSAPTKVMGGKANMFGDVPVEIDTTKNIQLPDSQHRP